MATFSEQLESALGGSDSSMSASAIEDILSGTSTTVQPGTVTPTGGGNINWNQIFENITTETPLKAGQGLPDVPKGIPASTFYREATKAGKLPSGASQFFVKPLAPETKPFNLNTSTTPTSTTTPSTTSSSNQNIVRQLRETAELDNIGDSEGYDGLSQQYSSDTYSSENAAKALADENAFLTDTYSDPTVKTNYLDSATDYLSNLGEKAIGLVSDIPNPLDLASDKIDDIKENPFLEAGKLALGYLAPPLASPFISPLISALTSEGMGQIGMPGLNKDDYWGGGGPDGRGVETRSTVAGFADVPGYAMAVAVDAKGNVLSSPYGPTKGVVMYGIPTPAGTKAYQDKTYNRTSYNTPDQLPPSDDGGGGYSGLSGEDSADVGGTGDIGSGISAPTGIGSDPDDDGDCGSGSDSGGDGASDDAGAGDSYGED